VKAESRKQRVETRNKVFENREQSAAESREQRAAKRRDESIVSKG
jgi:hypothetical protein